MSTDDQFTAALGPMLQAELAGLHAAPGLAVSVRRTHLRQTRVLRATVATPIIAAVAVVSFAATGSSVPDRPQAQGGTAGTGFRSVAYVSAHTDTALANASNYVLRTSSPVGVISWTDPVTGRSRADSAGPPATSSLRSGPVAQGPTVLTVDYGTRTWWTRQLPPLPAGTPVGLDAYTDPKQIRAALNAGALQLIGGVDTIHLRLAGNPQLDLWVDAGSYLPVRLTGTKGKDISTVTFAWLPRTAENLAKTELSPPAGYPRHQQQAIPTAQVKPAN